MNGILERLMNRYRGTSGLLGWLIVKADVRWLKRIVRTSKGYR